MPFSTSSLGRRQCVIEVQSKCDRTAIEMSCYFLLVLYINKVKLCQISKSGQDFYRKLADLDDLQSNLLLLIFCQVPGSNHLSHSVNLS